MIDRCSIVTDGSYISLIPGGGIRVGDLSSLLTFKIIKGVAIDIDHRLTKQQYTSLLPFNGIKGDRKTSCMACQQQKKIGNCVGRLFQKYVLRLGPR